MSKRPGGLGGLLAKRAKLDEQVERPSGGGGAGAGGAGGPAGDLKNPFLSRPVQPEKSISQFLQQARQAAINYLPKEQQGKPITVPFCEIEARLGVLKVNDRRVTSSGPKLIRNTVVPAFDCTQLAQRPALESGLSRSHYVHWTLAGLSEPSPVSAALGVVVSDSQASSSSSISQRIKAELHEHEYVESVFAGYPGDRRLTFSGLVLPHSTTPLERAGQMEYKEKLTQLDLCIPAAKYDMRIGLASEKIVDRAVLQIPAGWSTHRVKRRRSYTRKDKNICWQIDVTEVTSTPRDETRGDKTVVFEMELELQTFAMLQLLNLPADQVPQFTQKLASQAWWIMSQLNPTMDTIDVEEYLVDHPNQKAVQLALATCGALKQFMDHSGGGGTGPFQSPIATPNSPPSPSLANLKFCGCMPVNFSRHDLDKIQNSTSGGYFCSEKTDGVRHFMIFTGDTVVLVDRAMRGKQPKWLNPAENTKDNKKEPMSHVLDLIQPGTVLDGEVVIHRGGANHKARPVFIVFDVMTISPTKPVLQETFEKRLRHLNQASFRTASANRDMFDVKYLSNSGIPLPLIRKNFVKRTQLEELFSHVLEDKGLRSYRNGEVHNHLTDGIIFQPNLPYVCGTDVNLLKWKYLDTVTIDVELLPPRPNHRNHGGGGGGGDDDEEVLRVGVLGEEQTMVDMSRYVQLPKSERYRLQADRREAGNARITEVGFDPDTGEWYYKGMRPDKVAPNHISTVLGTLLELSESLTPEELQYRLSIPDGQRDTYRKDVRKMLKQLLDHQKQQRRQPPPQPRR
jgi:hypothetical protein